MVSLCLTSFLFSTTVLHSFYTRDVLYHHTMLSVMALSIAVHTFHYIAKSDQEISNYFKYICLIDRIVAHLAFCVVFCDMLMLVFAKSIWYSGVLIFPYIILMSWILEHSPTFKHMHRSLHTILHATSICAVHVMLCLKARL